MPATVTAVMRPRGARIVLSAAAVLFAVVLAGAAVLGARQEAPSRSPERPEATAQSYLRALATRDRLAALATFTEDLRARCRADFERMSDFPEIDRAELLGVRTTGDRATVEVGLNVAWSGSLFDGGGSTFPLELRLVQTAAGWQIEQVPWPLGSCSAPPSGP